MCVGTEVVMPGALAGVQLVTCSPAVRSGFLHLAEALTFRGDLEAVSSTVRAIVATLKSGEQCDVEPELVSKGTQAAGSIEDPLLLQSPSAGRPQEKRIPGAGLCVGVRRALGRCDRYPLCPAVLRGLIEVRSPHLEELLAALFSTASAVPGSGPVAVVSSLLLPEKEEPLVPGKDADSCR